MASSALVLTGCGTTVDLRSQQAGGLNGGIGSAGTTAEGFSVDSPTSPAITEGSSGSTIGPVASRPATSTGPTEPDGTPAGQAGKPAAGTPLEIGLLIVDTAAYTKAIGGVNVSQSEFYKASVHAFVKAINAEGGVAGRKLKLVDAAVEITAPDTASQFEAACATFTQDNRVGAVIDDGVFYSSSFNTCLTKARVPLLYMGMAGGSAVGDVTDLASNPGMVGVNSVSLDRTLAGILDKALSTGYLKTGSKLGVLVEDCPSNVRAFERTLTPIVDRAKVSVVRVSTRCAQAASDQGQIVSDLQGAALRFRAAEVDTVMFVTAFENGYLYYFAQGAESQRYAPQYLLFRQQGGPSAKGQYPQAQLVRMRGFGGMPLADLTQPPAPPPAQAAVRKTCLATARSQDVTPSTNDLQVQWFYSACDAVSLLRRALVNSGGRAGTEHLVPAIERIGADFTSALNLNGVSRFGPGRHDGMEVTAVSVYQSTCDCFVYTTKPTPMG